MDHKIDKFPRSGLGYDVHAFDEDVSDQNFVTLGGVQISHDKKLKGHSDADVALHALTDAILGAICAGDIGQHFPPSDPQWKGKDSRHFLAHAKTLVEEKDGKILHVDVTLVCQSPKVGPHREAIKSVIADVLDLNIQNVSVKATTTEGLGFAGRAEGIAAYAVATVYA